jgi:hypothetical protein
MLPATPCHRIIPPGRVTRRVAAMIAPLDNPTAVGALAKP